MRRSVRLLCSKVDLDGNPSAYYPRFRPRRLVMPVDPSNVHSPRRRTNPIIEKLKDARRRQNLADRHGSLRLASVPAERTVGDAFRVLLEACERGRFFDPTACFSSPALQQLEECVRSARTVAEDARRSQPLQRSEAEKLENAEGDRLSSLPPALADVERADTAGSSSTLRVRAVDSMWDLLDRTPLNSPVHGALALRGKAVVERTVATTAYDAFPRLRSKHLQQLLHETCGLLPSSRVAVRLGFAQHAGVESEIGMWRELNVLAERARTARRQAAAHLERVEKGVVQQRRWYWRGVVRSAVGRLKMFPATMDDLQPRMEWIRSSMFAFVGFVEMAERSGEAGVDVKTFVLKMYASQLGHFAYQRSLENVAEKLAADLQAYSTSRVGHSSLAGSEDSPSTLTQDLTSVTDELSRELHRVRNRTPDEIEVLNAKSHPLSERADRRHEQFESSGGAHAVQALKDDLLDDYEGVRYARLAPPLVVSALDTQNALKEAQLILKYAADVSPTLRGAPIDVDQVIRKTVEVHETNNYASLSGGQQFRAVEYTVCRLFCGERCVGEGKGETLMEAIQHAALHMTNNYYLRGNIDTAPAHSAVRSSPGEERSRPQSTADAGKVRLRHTQTEERVVL